MQAFNLTRLNFHSPYKVWIDNGSYKFLTDYGVQYRIEFEEEFEDGQTIATICNITELSNHYK